MALGGIHQDALEISARSSEPYPGVRTLVGQAQVKLSEALEHLRAAFRAEANDEGDWQQAIWDTQRDIEEAMRGCASMLLEMGKARR